MAKLDFQNLSFTEHKDSIEVRLLDNFFFSLRKEDLQNIGEFSIGENHIDFPGQDEKKVSKKFNHLIAEGMDNLNNKLNGKPAVYVHRNSGIPLIGTLHFGIVDRGTTIVEVKPLTSCNLNCIFCSVDEGLSSRKSNDFVVESDYIIEELKSLLEFKQEKGIEIFINPHGEPLLYGDLIDLVRGIKAIEQVSSVSIATNGSLLTEELADELAEAGLDQLNISLNSLDEQNSKMIAGTKEFDIKSLKKVMEHVISQERIRIVLAPVWIPGVNDKDIESIISYCNEKGCGLGVQKYVRHKKGRNPDVEEMDWKGFFKELESLQDEYGTKLLYPEGPEKTKELPKPFRTGDTIKARIACNGRYRGEMIAAAHDRAITVYDSTKSPGETEKIRIIRSRNNVYSGKAV
ncbi:radical SAM protein [Candidatus Woesearchaeota archaeon]|nr:radical SAM protein [Candidatus Woesearchaeota archaeon]